MMQLRSVMFPFDAVTSTVSHRIADTVTWPSVKISVSFNNGGAYVTSSVQIVLESTRNKPLSHPENVTYRHRTLSVVVSELCREIRSKSKRKITARKVKNNAKCARSGKRLWRRDRADAAVDSRLSIAYIRTTFTSRRH